MKKFFKYTSLLFAVSNCCETMIACDDGFLPEAFRISAQCHFGQDKGKRVAPERAVSVFPRVFEQTVPQPPRNTLYWAFINTFIALQGDIAELGRAITEEQKVLECLPETLSGIHSATNALNFLFQSVRLSPRDKKPVSEFQNEIEIAQKAITPEMEKRYENEKRHAASLIRKNLEELNSSRRIVEAIERLAPDYHTIARLKEDPKDPTKPNTWTFAVQDRVNFCLNILYSIDSQDSTCSSMLSNALSRIFYCHNYTCHRLKMTTQKNIQDRLVQLQSLCDLQMHMQPQSPSEPQMQQEDKFPRCGENSKFQLMCKLNGVLKTLEAICGVEVPANGTNSNVNKWFDKMRRDKELIGTAVAEARRLVDEDFLKQSLAEAPQQNHELTKERKVLELLSQILETYEQTVNSFDLAFKKMWYVDPDNSTYEEICRGRKCQYDIRHLMLRSKKDALHESVSVLLDSLQQ
jgi:hypothetical protein